MRNSRKDNGKRGEKKNGGKGEGTKKMRKFVNWGRRRKKRKKKNYKKSK